MIGHLFVTALLALTAISTAQCPKYKYNLVSESSKTAAGLEAAVAKYQKLLGGKDNLSNPGPLKSGFRRINWDADAVPFDMPGNFFDATVTRGAVFKAKSGEFRVSNPPDKSDDRFNSILPSKLTNTFLRFSEPRLFTPLRDNKVTVTFKVPAKPTPATVTGFGAIFVDVDKWKVTKLEYYDQKGCLIARIFVKGLNKGLSFAGLVVVDPKWPKRRLAVVNRVRITAGNISLWKFAQAYTGKLVGDVVVMDDFFYGEPQRKKKGGKWQ